jgi:hypothetical protein
MTIFKDFLDGMLFTNLYPYISSHLSFFMPFLPSWNIDWVTIYALPKALTATR